MSVHPEEAKLDKIVMPDLSDMTEEERETLRLLLVKMVCKLAVKFETKRNSKNFRKEGLIKQGIRKFLSSKFLSPIIVTQLRVGKDGCLFDMYKFRTMTDETDETDDNGALLPDDQRITRWGDILRHLGWDEAPQIINILLGDMDLVGPRPPMVDEDGTHRNEWDIIFPHQLKLLTSVKPGIFSPWTAREAELKAQGRPVTILEKFAAVAGYAETVSSLEQRIKVAEVFDRWAKLTDELNAYKKNVSRDVRAIANKGKNTSTRDNGLRHLTHNDCLRVLSEYFNFKYGSDAASFLKERDPGMAVTVIKNQEKLTMLVVQEDPRESFPIS